MVVEDGNCSVSTKSHNAEFAGAAVLVIINSNPTDSEINSKGNIPTIFISGEEAMLIKKTGEREEVVMSIGFGKPVGKVQSEVEF